MDKVAEILNKLLDPVGQALNTSAASALLSLRADAEAQAQIDDLANRCNEGELTAAEQAEYESLIAASALIAVLQAKARARLATPPAA
jgi:hypothetical protein